jgi:hypothetical protein
MHCKYEGESISIESIKVVKIVCVAHLKSPLSRSGAPIGELAQQALQ